MTNEFATKPTRLRTWNKHRRARANAERKRAQAQREFNGLQRRARGELRQRRRASHTATIIARSRLAEIAIRTITALTAKPTEPRS